MKISALTISAARQLVSAVILAGCLVGNAAAVVPFRFSLIGAPLLPDTWSFGMAGVSYSQYLFRVSYTGPAVRLGPNTGLSGATSYGIEAALNFNDYGFGGFTASVLDITTPSCKALVNQECDVTDGQVLIITVQVGSPAWDSCFVPGQPPGCKAYPGDTVTQSLKLFVVKRKILFGVDVPIPQIDPGLESDLYLVSSPIQTATIGTGNAGLDLVVVPQNPNIPRFPSRPSPIPPGSPAPDVPPLNCIFYDGAWWTDLCNP